MPKLSFEVRKNALVIDFDVFSNETGLVERKQFKKKKKGIYVYTHDVAKPGNIILVRLIIYGTGSATMPPRAVCITSLNDKEFPEVIRTSIPDGTTTASVEDTYNTSPNVAPETVIP